jgi:hypothetical protein
MLGQVEPLYDEGSDAIFGELGLLPPDCVGLTLPQLPLPPAGCVTRQGKGDDVPSATIKRRWMRKQVIPQTFGSTHRGPVTAPLGSAPPLPRYPQPHNVACRRIELLRVVNEACEQWQSSVDHRLAAPQPLAAPPNDLHVLAATWLYAPIQPDPSRQRLVQEECACLSVESR